MGHQDGRVLGEVVGEALRVAGLDREVELPLERGAQLIDDLDGSEASETLEFALDGVSYQIDLSSANANKLRDGLAKTIAWFRSIRLTDYRPPTPNY